MLSDTVEYLQATLGRLTNRKEEEDSQLIDFVSIQRQSLLAIDGALGYAGKWLVR